MSTYSQIVKKIKYDNGGSIALNPNNQGYMTFTIKKKHNTRSPLGTLYRKSSCADTKNQVKTFLHIAIYCYAAGKVPKNIGNKRGMLTVDHVDVDIKNNDPSNLRLIPTELNLLRKIRSDRGRGIMKVGRTWQYTKPLHKFFIDYKTKEYKINSDLLYKTPEGQQLVELGYGPKSYYLDLTQKTRENAEKLRAAQCRAVLRWMYKYGKKMFHNSWKECPNLEPLFRELFMYWDVSPKSMKRRNKKK